jgi:uncharacterized protein (DUF488 family)
MSTRLFTIGFAGTSAESFFDLLRSAGVLRVIDVRLNNTSQLAGFTKKGDLAYFLREVAGIEYVHVPELAPTQEILDAYRKHKGRWAVFEEEFGSLMVKRGVEHALTSGTAHMGCLLCSEKLPHRCHRRLVAEYLTRRWARVLTTHLV